MRPAEVELTIIVPAYNVGKKIENALRSLAQQRTKHTYEVLIIAGPSTDETRDVARDFAAKYPGFFVLDYPEKNVLGARMLGIENARGRYIGFCDGDDAMEDYAVDVMASTLAHTDADVVQTGFYFVKAHRTKPTFFRRDKTYDRGEFYRAMLKDDYVRGYLWCKAFRRELFEDFPLVVPKENLYREDTYFLFHACAKMNKAVTLKVPTYYYDKTGESGFSAPTKKRVDDFLAVLGVERLLHESFGDEALLRFYRKMKIRRKAQLFFDLWLTRKAYDKGERSLRKKELKRYLKMLSSPEPLPVEGMPWEALWKK